MDAADPRQLPDPSTALGSRLARLVVARYGQHRVFRTAGTLRAVWLIGLAFVRLASSAS